MSQKIYDELLGAGAPELPPGHRYRIESDEYRVNHFSVKIEKEYRWPLLPFIREWIELEKVLIDVEEWETEYRAALREKGDAAAADDPITPAQVFAAVLRFLWRRREKKLAALENEQRFTRFAGRHP